jgi:hypothetical protein
MTSQSPARKDSVSSDGQASSIRPAMTLSTPVKTVHPRPGRPGWSAAAKTAVKPSAIQ